MVAIDCKVRVAPRILRGHNGYVANQSIQENVVRVYRFKHITTGRVQDVPEDTLEEHLLDVVGGGYTVAQVSMAMVLHAELTDSGEARSANFEITLLPEQA